MQIPNVDIVCLIKNKKLCRARKLLRSITLCYQEHEEDQLQLECRTQILKNWTINNILLLLQMQVLVPRLEGVLDTLDMFFSPLCQTE